MANFSDCTRGAIVATVLGFREITKEKRKLKIILEEIRWSCRHQVIITNIGHRLITITDIHVFTYSDRDELPSKDDPWDKDRPQFPFKLQDGESVKFLLGNNTSDRVLNDHEKLAIVVYDNVSHVIQAYHWSLITAVTGLFK